MSLTPQWRPNHPPRPPLQPAWRPQPWVGNHQSSGFGQQGGWVPPRAPMPPRSGPSRNPLWVVLVVLLLVAVGLFGRLWGTVLDGQRRAAAEASPGHSTQQARPTRSTQSPGPSTSSPATSTATPTRTRSASPTPTPTPTPTPETAPEPTDSNPEPTTGWRLPKVVNEELPAPSATSGPWARLQQSPLYDQFWPGMPGCAEATHIETVEELETVARTELDCLEANWRPLLERLGLPTHPVPLHVFEGDSINTPCGESSSTQGFYCSANGGAIYISTKAMDPSQYSKLWVKRMMFHEYAHHLQSLIGVFYNMADVEDQADATRRLEVQAECMAMGILRRDPTWPITKKNYREIEELLVNFVDDGVHGTPETLSRWGIRAYHSRTIGEGCNTWLVADGEIK
ncbi:hypothetical protein EII34_05245 [Arachnia propionica]|uniref:Neutral zinc metallopeptidase n=2 Tax=Arachnia propionica TaxID=1750 RepID=A0A3P1T9S5_9ACTN|nr:neutral zinc metallopeptidase [Arachnia propionica]RRD06090.1 hypothetical protein EII34_05245 [Arachnia propionica]